MVDRVLLARHGESESNERGLVSGDPRTVYELTSAGRQQAGALGSAIANDAIDLCVTSEFTRAMQTADIVLTGRDVPRLVLTEFNDARVDGFEGLPFPRMQEWVIDAGPLAYPPGGGERRVDSVLRVCRGFRMVLARRESNVLIVDHVLGVIVGRMREGGEDAVVSVDDFPVPHAECYRLDAGAVADSVAVVERWAKGLTP